MSRDNTLDLWPKKWAGKTWSGNGTWQHRSPWKLTEVELQSLLIAIRARRDRELMLTAIGLPVDVGLSHSKMNCALQLLRKEGLIVHKSGWWFFVDSAKSVAS